MLISPMGPPVFMGEYDPEPIDDDEKRQLAEFRKSGGLIKPHSNDVMKDFLKGMARPGKKKRETSHTASASNDTKCITTRKASDIFEANMEQDPCASFIKSGLKRKNDELPLLPSHDEEMVPLVHEELHERPCKIRCTGKQEPRAEYFQYFIQQTALLRETGQLSHANVSAARDLFVKFWNSTSDNFSGGWVCRKARGRLAWNDMSNGEHCMWIILSIRNPEQSPVPSTKFFKRCDVPMQLMQVADNRNRCRVRGVMLTYNGNWGFDLEDIMDVIEQGVEGLELTQFMAEHPFYNDLLNRCVCCVFFEFAIFSFLHFFLFSNLFPCFPHTNIFSLAKVL
jgi:hypothetical protein